MKKLIGIGALALTANLAHAQSWAVTGNTGLTTNAFLGTTDNIPLVLKANNARALELRPGTLSEAGATISGNAILGGSASNTVNSGAIGAVVLGGLTIDGGQYINRAHDLGCGVLSGAFNLAGSEDINHSNSAYSVIAGGYNNTAGGYANFVGGGIGNIASGDYAVVPGGHANNAFGAGSFAGGSYTTARSTDNGTFIWSDDSSTDQAPFISTAPRQFLINAGGGIGFNTNAPHGVMEVSGNSSFTRPTLVLNETLGSFSRVAFTSSLSSRFWHFSGNVNGATSNADRLNFYHSVGQNVMQLTGDARVGIGVNAPSSGIRLDVGGAIRCASLIQTSSRVYKNDIEDMQDGLSTLMALRPVTYRWNELAPQDQQGRSDLGFIAEEVADVLPDAVARDESGCAVGVDYSRVAVVAVRAIQDLKAQNDDLKARLERLEKLLADR